MRRRLHIIYRRVENPNITGSDKWRRQFVSMSQDGGEIKPAVDVGELGWLVLGDDVSSLRDISMMKSISVEDEIRSLITAAVKSSGV
jgi:hypothetical protein